MLSKTKIIFLVHPLLQTEHAVWKCVMTPIEEIMEVIHNKNTQTYYIIIIAWLRGWRIQFGTGEGGKRRDLIIIIKQICMGKNSGFIINLLITNACLTTTPLSILAGKKNN